MPLVNQFQGFWISYISRTTGLDQFCMLGDWRKIKNELKVFSWEGSKYYRPIRLLNSYNKYISRKMRVSHPYILNVDRDSKRLSGTFKLSCVIIIQHIPDIQFNLSGSSHLYCYLFNPIITNLNENENSVMWLVFICLFKWKIYSPSILTVTRNYPVKDTSKAASGGVL